MMSDVLDQPTIVHEEPAPRGGDHRKGVVVRTPYNAEFVNDLKFDLDHPQRLWNEDDEEWWVEEQHASYIEELVVQHFGHCRIVEPGGERYRDEMGQYEQGGLF